MTHKCHEIFGSLARLHSCLLPVSPVLVASMDVWMDSQATTPSRISLASLSQDTVSSPYTPVRQSQYTDAAANAAAMEYSPARPVRPAPAAEVTPPHRGTKRRRCSLSPLEIRRRLNQSASPSVPRGPNPALGQGTGRVSPKGRPGPRNLAELRRQLRQAAAAAAAEAKASAKAKAGTSGRS